MIRTSLSISSLAPLLCCAMLNLAGCGSSPDSNTNQTPQVPTLTSVSPLRGPAAGGTSITLTGTHLTGTTAVNIGATMAASFNVESDTKVTAVTQPGSGAVNIFVVNSAGSSNSVAFSYGSAPVLSNLAPIAGNVAGGTPVTLTGDGFTGASSVTFGGVAASSFQVVSDTQISAVSPESSAGAVPVVVTTAFGNSTGVNFTYGHSPSLTSLNPNYAPTNSPNVIVTLAGTNLTAVTSVTIGGTAVAGFTVVSDAQINIVLPSVSIAGTTTLLAVAPFGTSNDLSFTFGNAPTLTSVSPSAGPPAGGTSVTITGTGFSGATAVSFGTVAATEFTVDSNTQITAAAPAGTGSINLTVTTAYGVSNGIGFAYGNLPALTSLTPSRGLSAGNTSVVIVGSHFTGATAVEFGSTAATSFTVDSDTQITAVSPSGSDGSSNVVVTTVNGASNELSFTYAEVPSITSLDPPHGAPAGNTSVIIAGSNFTGATAVQFGGTAAMAFTVNSDTQITAVSPAGTGTVDVTVVTSLGTSGNSSFIYTPCGAGVVGATLTAATSSPISFTGTGFLSTLGYSAGDTSVTFCETAGDCTQPWSGPSGYTVIVSSITNTRITSNSNYGPTCKSVCNAAGTLCTNGVISN